VYKKPPADDIKMQIFDRQLITSRSKIYFCHWILMAVITVKAWKVAGISQQKSCRLKMLHS